MDFPFKPIEHLSVYTVGHDQVKLTLRYVFNDRNVMRWNKLVKAVLDESSPDSRPMILIFDPHIATYMLMTSVTQVDIGMLVHEPTHRHSFFPSTFG